MQDLHALLWMLVIIALVKLEFIAVVSWTNDMLIKVAASDDANAMTTKHDNLSVIIIPRTRNRLL